MLDAAESVFIADLTTPFAERAVVNFHDRAAIATDQVMMVAVPAGAVCGLAVGAADRIDLTVLFETAEIAVDGGQADLVEALVQLLRSQRALALGERFDDRGTLNRGAAGAGALIL